MTEAQVIAKTLIYLILKEDFTVEKVSIRTKEEESELRQLLATAEIGKDIIEKMQISRSGIDIIGNFMFKQGRPQKKLHVEAKGGDVYYNFYTLLGQFITVKKSPSTYYWFAFALPYSWLEKVKKYLTYKHEIKPIVRDIIEKYTKNGQGLWFYFVEDDGNVQKMTWKQLLNAKHCT